MGERTKQNKNRKESLQMNIIDFEIKHGAENGQFKSFGFKEYKDCYKYQSYLYKNLISLLITVDKSDYNVTIDVLDCDGATYWPFYNEDMRGNNDVVAVAIKRYNDIVIKGKHDGLFFIKKNSNLKTAFDSKNHTEKIRIKYFSDKIEKLKYIDEKSDWIDLRVAEDVTMKKGEFRLIPLGVAMQLPKGYEAHVVPRSSTYKNFGVIQTNHMGVIDESYRGDSDQWHFPAYALRNTEIHLNDRICQFRIVKKQPDIVFEEVKSLGNKNRGGIGSTGKN